MRLNIAKAILGCLVAAVLMGAAPGAHAQQDLLVPGEMIFIDVYRHPEFSTTGRINAQGNISVPFVGSVSVGGLSQSAAEQTVRQALERFLRNPRVSVSRDAGSGLNREFRSPVMRTELIPLNNGDAEMLAEQLDGMVSEGGDMAFDPTTNTLIVTDTPDALQNIANVINQLDQMENRLQQVRIEVKIAEVQAGALEEIGVRWFKQGQETGFGFFPGPIQDTAIQNLRGGNASGAQNEQVRAGGANRGAGGGREFVNEDDFDRRLQIPIQVPTAGQLFFGLLNDDLDIGAFIDALVADDKAQLLASPNILTPNHKRAEIRRVEEFPFQQFSLEPSGRSVAEVRFIDLGIILGVTPHVLRDPDGRQYVKLELEPEVSMAVGTTAGVPIRSVRSTKSEANLRNGQSLVIGGIYKQDTREFDQGVPGLRKVPILGHLFSRKEERLTETELMIFVKPVVHDTPDSITVRDMIAIQDEEKGVNALEYANRFSSGGEERRE